VDRQDASCYPELANDIGLGTQYRSEAKAYIDYHLGLVPDHTPEPDYENPQLGMFALSAQILKKGADHDTIKRFRDEVFFYIDCCQQEQEDRLQGRLPSSDTYWRMRLGTTAVYPCCAAIPYVIPSR
jgi:hypothetical protein